MTARLGTYWREYWFAPSSAVDLACARIAFLGALFLYYLPHDYSALPTVGEVFWNPIWAFQTLGFGRAGSSDLVVLQLLWKLSLFFACIGLFTRTSLLVAVTLGFYLLGTQHGFTKVRNNDGVVWFVLLILAASRCGDLWSVDEWIRVRLRGRPPRATTTTTSPEYTWPIRMVWMLLAMVFFLSGVQKLRESGLAWLTSGHLRYRLMEKNYPSGFGEVPLVSWGWELGRSAWVGRFVAIFTLVMELGYPLALVWKWARWVFPAGTVLMLIGIRSLMGPPFELFVLCHLFWVPWERVIAAFAGPERGALRART